MNKLTTETLKEIIGSYPEGSDEIECVMARKLLAYETAADRPVIPEQTERERIRREHAEWSEATFGNVGPVGPLKHLSKEALEAAADPDDLLEWADMQFLLWDAQRRAGIPDDFITIAMIEKLEINKKRQWPEPKDGEPRLHINTQSAQPVIPEQSEPVAYTDNRNLKSLQKGCNTALLWLKHYAEVGDIPLYTEVPTQPVSEHKESAPVGYFSYGSECGFDWHNTEKEAIEAAEAVIDDYRGDACDGWSEETDSVCWGVILQQATKVDERPRTDDDKCDPAIDTVCDYALLPELVGNSPVIPDGWVMVPQQIFLDASDIESICSQCGDGHKSGYGDFTDGLLWVGDIQCDNGTIMHGLHISSSDYQEEGGLTLAEFAAPAQESE